MELIGGKIGTVRLQATLSLFTELVNTYGAQDARQDQLAPIAHAVIPTIFRRLRVIRESCLCCLHQLPNDGVARYKKVASG